MKIATAKNRINVLMAVSVLCSATPLQVFADDSPTSSKPPAQVQAETQKAIYDAEKAKYDAETAAANAKVGSLSNYSTSGTIDVGANSGKLETTLMYSEAARAIGKLIVTSTNLKGLCKDSKPLIVTGSTDHLQFDAYDAFDAQSLSIEGQLIAATSETLPPRKEVTKKGVVTSGVSGIAAVGTLLNVAGNLFRSDYKLSGIDITPDDTLLIAAVVAAAREPTAARAIAKDPASAKQPTAENVVANDAAPACRIIVPGIYLAKSVDANNPAIKTLSALADLRENANRQLSQDTSQVSDAQTKAAALKDAAAEQMKNEAARYTQRIADLTAAIKRFDDFQTKLGTTDDKGIVPMAVIARQAKLAGMAHTGLLLSVKANFAGGSQYAKKNFWTFLGSMPFSVSGGAVASFALVDGSDGSVLASGVLGQSEPFTKIHKATERYIHGNPNP